MTNSGIDISQLQGSIDWRLLAPEIDFCIIKVDEGSTIKDSRAQDNARAADVTGTPFGYYHFAFPQRIIGDAASEFSYFKENLVGLPESTMGMALDLEVNPDGLDEVEYEAWATEFLERSEDLFAIDNIYVYGSPYFLSKVLSTDHGLGKYKLWLAEYTTEPKPRVLPCGWVKFDIWQYGQGRVNGIKADVDLNRLP